MQGHKALMLGTAAAMCVASTGAAEGSELPVNPLAGDPREDIHVIGAWNFAGYEEDNGSFTVPDISGTETVHDAVFDEADFELSTDTPFNHPAARSVVMKGEADGEDTIRTFRGELENILEIGFRRSEPQGGMSIEGWVKIEEYGSSSNDLAVLGLRGDESGTTNKMLATPPGSDEGVLMRAYSGGAGEISLQSDVQVPQNEWTHLAMTWTGSEVTLYKDGEVAETFSTPSRGMRHAGQIDRWVRMGGDWSGLMTDVRVSQGVLEAEDLGYHYTFVPEPGGVALVGLGGLMLLRRRW